MNAISKLPTVAEMQATRRDFSKGATRLDRKIVDGKVAAASEKAFIAAVWKRDKSICRCCGRRVAKSLALTQERGEVHHIMPRQFLAVRYDPRNGVLLCAVDHQRVTEHKLDIATKHSFTVVDAKGRRVGYLNADKPLQFVEVK